MNKIFIISFLLLIPINSFSQSNQKIELFDLLTMFIPETENTYNDWFTGADDDSPILWETEGANYEDERSEERRVGKECRSRWSQNH